MTAEHGLVYIEKVRWVIEDGTGYNKIRAEASIVKKEAEKELNPAMLKYSGPKGLDSRDIEYFFSMEQTERVP